MVPWSVPVWTCMFKTLCLMLCAGHALLRSWRLSVQTALVTHAVLQAPLDLYEDVVYNRHQPQDLLCEVLGGGQ